MYDHRGQKECSLRRKGVRQQCSLPKLQNVFISWFQDKPITKRPRVQRSSSLQSGSGDRSLYLWSGCCWIIFCILLVKYLDARFNPVFTMPVFKHKANDSGKSHLQDDVALTVPKKIYKPDSGNPNPSDWDLAFIEKSRLKLEEWSKSLANCFFEQRMTNELTFWAKFYNRGEFIFMETLKESRREYTKSDKSFLLYFGVKEKDYTHAEFRFNLPTSSFIISINDEFKMEFAEEGNTLDGSNFVVQPHDDNAWCSYDFNRFARYHIGCKIIPMEDKLQHTFDSFEFEFVAV